MNIINPNDLKINQNWVYIYIQNENRMCIINNNKYY